MKEKKEGCKKKYLTPLMFLPAFSLPCYNDGRFWERGEFAVKKYEKIREVSLCFLNRLTNAVFPDISQNIGYTYDNCVNGKGRLCQMIDALGKTDYEYDAIGRVVKESKIINNVIYLTEYAYDKNGNLVSVKYPSGRLIAYNYANDKVIGIVNNTATIASDINYQPFGAVKSLVYGNNIQQTIGHDQQYRITSITTGDIQNLSFTYDRNGNIAGITNNLDTTKNKTYIYDASDRFTSATGQWGTVTYTYDGVGNRQTEATATGVTNYTYTVNKLMSTTGEKTFAFDYDNNGNTIIDNTRQYIYNQNQRLIKMIEGGVTKGEYVYNGNGQRVKKTTPSGTVIFHYDLQGKIIAESTATGVVTADYVFLDGNPFAKIEGSNVYYYHNDHLGTPQKMTNMAGSVVWEGEFYPFGEPLSIMGSIVNNLRFPGQYYDSETGLNYNYYRDYNPVIGRYVESDPIGIKQGENHLYIYANGNALRFRDIDGLFCTWVGEKPPTKYTTRWKFSHTEPPKEWIARNLHIGRVNCVYFRDTFTWQYGHWECCKWKSKSYERELSRVTESKRIRGTLIPGGEHHMWTIDCPDYLY